MLCLEKHSIEKDFSILSGVASYVFVAVVSEQGIEYAKIP